MATIDTPKLSVASVVRPAQPSWLAANLGSHLREYGGTFATGFAVLGCQLMTYKLAAHFLGKTGFAEYALARRTISILYPVVLLGLGVGLPRYVAMAAGRGDRESGGRYLAATLWCVSLSAVVCVVILKVAPRGLAYLFFGSREYAFLLFPMSLVWRERRLHTVGYSYFRGTLNMRAANLLQLVNLGLAPLAVFFFYGTEHSGGADGARNSVDRSGRGGTTVYSVESGTKGQPLAGQRNCCDSGSSGFRAILF